MILIPQYKPLVPADAEWHKPVLGDTCRWMSLEAPPKPSLSQAAVESRKTLIRQARLRCAQLGTTRKLFFRDTGLREHFGAFLVPLRVMLGDPYRPLRGSLRYTQKKQFPDN